MRALITGAAGFIGSHLTEAALAADWRVTAIDSLTPYYSPEVKRRNADAFAAHPACRFLEEDLLDLDLPSLLADTDVVFHLAAQAGVRPSWGQSFEEYARQNVVALQRMLEAAKDAPPRRFVFASSSSVYGDAKALPTPEDMSLAPVSPYGATKVLGEHLARIYWKSFGVPVVCLRYFTVYGPRQRPDMAFHRAIAAVGAQRPFTLYGDGQQTRDFTYVDDAVSGTLAAAIHGRPGCVYNIGGGSRTSMSDVLSLIGRLMGREPLVERLSAQRGDAHDTAAETLRARADLGFAPRHALEAGVREQIEWQVAERTLVQP